VKTKKSDPILIPENTWSQQQQQALENAIQRNPKGVAGDRWQKIANNVPGKTKEECVLRYKYLVDLVKKQKIAPVDDPVDDSLNMADEEKVEGVEEEEESSVQDVVEEKAAVSSGRKTKNKRKEMKKNIDFYNNSDESDVSE
jgi:DnaJ homolog subfamily C member 1